MMEALFKSFCLPQNLSGGTIPNATTKKFTFSKEKNFVYSEHNLFHMRNGKEGYPT